MALTAQQVYNQSLASQRSRAGQMYGRQLEMLANQMRNASENLEANLEGRGVLRSGEANTARSRLQQQGATQRRYLTEDRDYQLQQLALDEQARKASQGGGGNAGALPTGGRTAEDIYDDLIKKSGFVANTGVLQTKGKTYATSPYGAMIVRPPSQNQTKVR